MDPGLKSDFCSKCHSVLPLFLHKGNITCYTCSMEYSPEAFNNLEGESYVIHFNSRQTWQDKTIKAESTEEGTLVDRRCPKCGHEKMSYETLQLRSADEGQTVFYTCVKCHFKDVENS